MNKRSINKRGYTMIEVMAALGVLAIGATGIIALQKTALISNTHAKNIAVANAIAMSWAERLRTDALQWNDPSAVPDIESDTDWLSAYNDSPCPTKVIPTLIPALGSPDADVLGSDIYAGDSSAPAFCTHLCFRTYQDAFNAPVWSNLIRVDIRVFWERNGNPVDCNVDPLDVDNGQDRYGAVYLTTSILQNTSEN